MNLSMPGANALTFADDANLHDVYYCRGEDVYVMHLPSPVEHHVVRARGIERVYLVHGHRLVCVMRGGDFIRIYDIEENVSFNLDDECTYSGEDQYFTWRCVLNPHTLYCCNLATGTVQTRLFDHQFEFCATPYGPIVMCGAWTHLYSYDALQVVHSFPSNYYYDHTTQGIYSIEFHEYTFAPWDHTLLLHTCRSSNYNRLSGSLDGRYYVSVDDNSDRGVSDNQWQARRFPLNWSLLAGAGSALPVVSPLASAGSVRLPLRGMADLPPELLRWIAHTF